MSFIIILSIISLVTITGITLFILYKKRLLIHGKSVGSNKIVGIVIAMVMGISIAAGFFIPGTGILANQNIVMDDIIAKVNIEKTA